MSKLYNAYTQLKKQDSKTIYLFKSGIFFIALNEDAHLLSNLFELKLGKLNDSVVKAGFPCSSYDKYENMFKSRNLNVQIVNVEEQKYTKFKEYTKNKSIANILDSIKKVDIDNLSITEAYQFIENLKTKINEITNV